VLEDLLRVVEDAQAQLKFFVTPEALHAIEALEEDLMASGLVGKSNSLAQIVKTVYRELRGGEADHYAIPDSAAGVSQTLLSYQSSHRPGDLGHLVTPDYRKANIWLQLKSGDNQDMETVTHHVDAYLAENPLPEGVTLRWAGLTYINIVWQEAMVRGMLESLLGSFGIVFLMMVLLFRSVVFGALAMIPLSITISFIYGMIGLIGKDFDMPVAVLSALTLGLSVDFAIHFLQRARAVQEETRSWKITASRMFEEPGRAIARNAIVIAVGFLPLLAAPLVPYNTVGIFMALIMAISSLVTVIVLPSILHIARRLIFRESSEIKTQQANGVTS
jgi:predicted RND superfamily exporter protein